jgi:two-component system, cell cycle response regulator
MRDLVAPTPGRILVAEDSGLLRAVVRSLLAPAGHTVLEAADGVQALAVLRSEPVDVVLCDVEMPRLDGYGVLAAIRDDPLLSAVPVVFLTGYTRSDAAAEGLGRGAYDYLRKPVDEVELRARVQAAVRTKRLTDELRERNAELERLSSTDALTGVANRRRMVAAMEGMVTGAVMVDIDHFKRVNDVHGHDAGDAVLAEVARRLGEVAPPGALVGRWGGEEFLVLTDEPAVVAAALHEAVRAAPVAWDDVTIALTASVGWAIDGDDPAHMLRLADEALYAAKAAGRDRVVGPAAAAA